MRKVRVRIPVGVGSDGSWGTVETKSRPYSNPPRDASGEYALRNSFDHDVKVAVYFVEATLDVPDDATVEGEVEGATP